MAIKMRSNARIKKIVIVRNFAGPLICRFAMEDPIVMRIMAIVIIVM